jgi:hypothetical protein
LFFRGIALVTTMLAMVACGGPVQTSAPGTALASPSTTAPVSSSEPPTQSPAAPFGSSAATVRPAETPAGPQTPGPTLEPRPTPAEGAYQPMTVAESGYTAVKDEANDYATFAAVLANPNTEWAIYRLSLQVNFFDASDGFLGGAEVQVTLLPGQTTAVSGQAYGAGSAVRMVVAPLDDPTPYMPFSSSGTIEVSDVQTSASEVGVLTTGTLTSSLTSDQTFLQLYSVYRDASGAVVGGATGAVESIPSGGGAAFEISDSQPPPGWTATEVYWQLGGQLPS